MDKQSEKLYVKKLLSKMVIGGVGLHAMYKFSDYVGINDLLSTLVQRSRQREIEEERKRKAKEEEEERKRKAKEEEDRLRREEEERKRLRLTKYNLGKGIVSFYYNDPLNPESGNNLINGFDLLEEGEYDLIELLGEVEFRDNEITQVRVTDPNIEVQIYTNIGFGGSNAIIRSTDGLVNLKK